MFILIAGLNLSSNPNLTKPHIDDHTSINSCIYTFGVLSPFA